MNGNLYERCLIQVFTEIIEEKGLKHKPLAELAWSDQKDPGTRWRSIRNNTRARLSIGDAYDLSEALGVNFLEVCALAQAKYREISKKSFPTKSHQKMLPDSSGDILINSDSE